jgi:hypothetical protein
MGRNEKSAVSTTSVIFVLMVTVSASAVKSAKLAYIFDIITVVPAVKVPLKLQVKGEVACVIATVPGSPVTIALPTLRRGNMELGKVISRVPLSA